MTKETLKDTILGTLNPEDYRCLIIVKDLLDKFFSQNVCIPKGENRHEYADIYHAFAEGVPTQYSSDNVNWYDMDTSASCFRRIKPSEPVYEWKYSFSTYGHKLTTDNFMTDEEARKYQLPLIFSKIEETKRVRQ